MPEEDPLVQALRGRIDVLEREIEALRGTIYGQQQFGWAGLMNKAETLEGKQQELKNLLDAVEEREKRREWERERAERFQKIAFSGVLAVLVPLAVQAFSTLIFGG